MDSVQYLEMRPQPNAPTFTPGRGIPQSCLTPDFPEAGEDIALGCILAPETDGPDSLLNVSEYMRTVENQSNYNQVYLSSGQAVLGPRGPPQDLDSSATSFGSKTSCDMVTNLCYSPEVTIEGPEPSQYSDFDCNTTTAGLNLTGSFVDLTYSDSSGGGSSGAEYGDAGYGLLFQYYNDTQKLHQVVSGEVLVDQRSTQLFWGLVFELQFAVALLGSVYSTNLTNNSDPASFGLVTQPGGAGAGILSCETNLSEIVSKGV